MYNLLALVGFSYFVIDELREVLMVKSQTACNFIIYLTTPENEER